MVNAHILTVSDVSVQAQFELFYQQVKFEIFTVYLLITRKINY